MSFFFFFFSLERLRKIEEHMNEMRGEKGDAVRASVVSKLKDQTATSRFRRNGFC